MTAHSCWTCGRPSTTDLCSACEATERELATRAEAPPASSAAQAPPAAGNGAPVAPAPTAPPSASPVAIDGAGLLDELVAFVRRYVVLTPEQARAVALWIVHTHAFGAAEATPYLAINSPEKGSGKTRLLEVLDLLVARPWFTGRVTAAVLARKVDKEQPTLLLDESDAAFAGEKEYAEALRGLLNSGYRRGGKASVCVGQGANISYRDLSTFCAKAIAGIGKLPDTVADRAIPIRMQRRTRAEPVEKLRRRDVEPIAARLREQLATWAEANLDALRAARPAIADSLADAIGDRAADVWEPLFAIADLAEGDWPEWTRRDARALSASGRREDDGSLGVRLLGDIRSVFNTNSDDRIASAALVAALVLIEEAPWCEWHGKPITAHGVAKLLHRFEIRPRTIRVGDATPKGYAVEQFREAFSRYLAADPPSATATPPQPAPLSEREADPNRNTTPDVAVAEKAANPHGYSDVAAVAVAEGRNGEVAGSGGSEAAGRTAPPGLGDPGFRGLLNLAFEGGHLTERERRERRLLHGLVVQAAAPR